MSSLPRVMSLRTACYGKARFPWPARWSLGASFGLEQGELAGEPLEDAPDDVDPAPDRFLQREARQPNEAVVVGTPFGRARVSGVLERGAQPDLPGGFSPARHRHGPT